MLRLYGRFVLWWLNSQKRMYLGAEQIPVFGGSTALDLFEGAVKGGEAGKAGLQRHLRDGVARFQQQGLGGLDPAVAHIVIKIIAGTLLEQPGEVELGKPRHIGYLFQCDVLRVMLIQIVEDRVEFFCQILLARLADRVASCHVLHGDTVPHIIHKKRQKVRVDHHVPQAVIAEIVAAQLGDQGCFFLINRPAAAFVDQHRL